MPIYEFECRDYGVFELGRTMAERNEPAPCPSCDQTSKRIVSLPSLAQLATTEVKARDRNEKSRHEPKVVTRENKSADGPRVARAAHSAYPWAIGH